MSATILPLFCRFSFVASFLLLLAPTRKTRGRKTVKTPKRRTVAAVAATRRSLGLVRRTLRVVNGSVGTRLHGLMLSGMAPGGVTATTTLAIVEAADGHPRDGRTDNNNAGEADLRVCGRERVNGRRAGEQCSWSRWTWREHKPVKPCARWPRGGSSSRCPASRVELLPSH